MLALLLRCLRSGWETEQLLEFGKFFGTLESGKMPTGPGMMLPTFAETKPERLHGHPHLLGRVAPKLLMAQTRIERVLKKIRPLKFLLLRQTFFFTSVSPASEKAATSASFNRVWVLAIPKRSINSPTA